MDKKIQNHQFALFISVCVLVLSAVYIFYKNEPINGRIESIYVSEMIDVGGVKQYIQIRGKNVNQPLLLFLHGGPGSAQSSFAYQYQEKLEENFVVINWDQRGAGKSYAKDIPKTSMTIAQFVSDTNEIVDYLRKKFNRDKVYLVGHSWGSLLGMMTIDTYPEKFYAYIGIGQVANMEEGERISYNFVLNEAKERKHDIALKELEAIGAPPYINIGDIAVQRKWLSEFGGSYKEVSFTELLEESLDEDEMFTYEAGLYFSITNLFWEFMEIDLIETVKEVQVPVYFCLGRHDYQTPATIAEEYFNSLKAPKKKLIWFESSAHSPNFEEPDKFADVLSMVRKETYDK